MVTSCGGSSGWCVVAMVGNAEQIARVKLLRLLDRLQLWWVSFYFIYIYIYYIIYISIFGEHYSLLSQELVNARERRSHQLPNHTSVVCIDSSSFTVLGHPPLLLFRPDPAFGLPPTFGFDSLTSNPPPVNDFSTFPSGCLLLLWYTPRVPWRPRWWPRWRPFPPRRLPPPRGRWRRTPRGPRAAAPAQGLRIGVRAFGGERPFWGGGGRGGRVTSGAFCCGGARCIEPCQLSKD